MKKRYLVTGAAGFVGRSIAKALLDEGSIVRGVDNFSTGKRENLRGLEAMDFVEGDLNDEQVSANVCREMDCIFHEAAIPSVPRSVAYPVGSNHANVSATVQLLNAARNAKVGRVVYAGSSSAYGNTETLPKREDMQPAPISPYAVSKLAGELYMRCFTNIYGLETVVIRYFNVFGPHQDPASQYSGVLAKFTLQMLGGKTPTIYGDGEQSRDFTYIDNVISANMLAAQAPAEKVSCKTFNVATGTKISLNDAVKQLRILTGYSGPVSFGEERSGDVKHSLADITRAQQAFGYQPLVDFNEGLKRTVEWYKTLDAVHRAG
jgi:UDP-glucose 4-epimerase